MQNTKLEISYASKARNGTMSIKTSLVKFGLKVYQENMMSVLTKTL